MKVLVDALEAIRDHAQHHALFAVRSMAVEALAAHRAAPLVDDAALRDAVARRLWSLDNCTDDTEIGLMTIAWEAQRSAHQKTYLRDAKEALRIVDEHLGRGQR